MLRQSSPISTSRTGSSGWLSLRRVLRPAGDLLVTVHGSKQDDPSQVAFTCAQLPHAAMRGIFPDWYQSAIHIEAYVRATCARYVTVVDYMPPCLDHSQDVVVLHKV
jgi:hypothetical protein